MLEDSFSQGFSETGRPGLSVRLVVGWHYLKDAFDLSDEELRSRWWENPYGQDFCGRRSFDRKVPFDGSSMTRWRKCFDGEKGELLLSQTHSDSGKVYCVHEPTVECRSKGKPHKKWEFGNQVSFVTTAKGNWIVGAQGVPWIVTPS